MGTVDGILKATAAAAAGNAADDSDFLYNNLPGAIESEFYIFHLAGL